MVIRRFYTGVGLRLFNTYGRNSFQFYSVYSKQRVRFVDSLNYKILQHFKRSTVYKTHTVPGNVQQTFNEEFFKSFLDDTDNLNQLSLSELLDGIVVIGRRYNHEVDIELVEKIDDECFRRLKAGLSLEDTLKVLNALMNLSNRAPQMRSFFLCLQLFTKMLKTGEDMNVHQFLQTLFFISLIKDEQPVREYFYIVKKKLSRQSNFLYSLNPFELAIFCTSIYKTGTKLTDEEVLKKLVDCINKNIKTLFSQSHLFTSTIKPLQHANYKDYKFLDKISKLLMKNELRLDDIGLIGSIYLLKLYANAHYNDEKFILFLADSILKSLQNSFDNNELIRIKDISVILQAFCQFGFDSLKQRIEQHLIPKIDELFEFEDHQKKLKYCIEILLWLNVLGICPRKTMEEFLSPRNLERGKRDGKLKHHARINLLLTIISIEHPDILVNKNVQHLKEDVVPTEVGIQLSHPELNKVQEPVKFLAACRISNIKSYRCVYLVPNLLIKGIVIETSRSSIAIELLGEKACLHDTNIPHGYMDLKLRLLRKMNYNIILVNKEDIQGKQEDLMAKIEDEIRRIDDLEA